MGNHSKHNGIRAGFMDNVITDSEMNELWSTIFFYMHGSSRTTREQLLCTATFLCGHAAVGRLD